DAVPIGDPIGAHAPASSYQSSPRGIGRDPRCYAAVMARGSRGQLDLQPAGFFLLRTPLLAIGELASWADGLEAAALGPEAGGEPLERALDADRGRLRARLDDLLARPEVAEALWTASPGLAGELDSWRRAPEGEAGQKIERALARYLARMTARPTPRALFAGV